MLAQISMPCNRWFEIHRGRKHISHQRLSPLCDYTSGIQRGNVHLICSQSLNSVFGGCIHLLMLLCTVCACMYCMWLESICQCALACFDDLASACVLSAQACEYGCVFRLGVGGGHLLLWHTSVTLVLSWWLLSCQAMQLSVPEKWVHSTQTIESDKNKISTPYLFQYVWPSPILIGAAWNINKRYISGLLAGDKRCWNRVWDTQCHFHFQLPTATVLLKAFIIATFAGQWHSRKSDKWSWASSQKKRCHDAYRVPGNQFLKYINSKRYWRILQNHNLRCLLIANSSKQRMTIFSQNRQLLMSYRDQGLLESHFIELKLC